MFLASMRHEPLAPSQVKGLDWKAIGYLTSIVSVLFLGAIAWPKDGEPAWYIPVLLIGMATSMIGMAFRYKAHLDEKREIRKAEAKADGRRP